jgi:hypothetical protein
VDDQALGSSSPMNEHSIKVMNCATCALSGFYLSCKVNVCHACLYNFGTYSLICVGLWLCAVVWLSYPIVDVVFVCFITVVVAICRFLSRLWWCKGLHGVIAKEQVRVFRLCCICEGSFGISFACLVGCWRTRDSSFVV